MKNRKTKQHNKFQIKLLKNCREFFVLCCSRLRIERKKTIFYFATQHRSLIVVNENFVYFKKYYDDDDIMNVISYKLGVRISKKSQFIFIIFISTRNGEKTENLWVIQLTCWKISISKITQEHRKCLRSDKKNIKFFMRIFN